MKHLAFIALLTALALLVWSSQREPTNNSPTPAAAPTKSASTSQSSPGEITNQEAKNEVTQVIQARGYDCEEVKLLFVEARDAYGHVTKAYCGPKGGKGIYSKQVFRVTVPPGDRPLIMVTPWD